MFVTKWKIRIVSAPGSSWTFSGAVRTPTRPLALRPAAGGMSPTIVDPSSPELGRPIHLATGQQVSHGGGVEASSDDETQPAPASGGVPAREHWDSPSEQTSGGGSNIVCACCLKVGEVVGFDRINSKPLLMVSHEDQQFLKAEMVTVTDLVAFSDVHLSLVGTRWNYVFLELCDKRCP